MRDFEGFDNVGLPKAKGWTVIDIVYFWSVVNVMIEKGCVVTVKMSTIIFRSGSIPVSGVIMASKSNKSKQRMWSQESMTAAVNAVNNEGSSLRATCRLYNVPIETLRRRVMGQVDVECRPGPQTILSKEEDCLAEYCIEMADRGFGLGKEDVMRFAFQIAEKMNKSHPFQNGMEGRGWYGRLLEPSSPSSSSIFSATVSLQSNVF